MIEKSIFEDTFIKTSSNYGMVIFYHQMMGRMVSNTKRNLHQLLPVQPVRAAVARLCPELGQVLYLARIKRRRKCSLKRWAQFVLFMLGVFVFVKGVLAYRIPIFFVWGRLHQSSLA